MPVITLENGARIRTFRPPYGFDPVTAAASELEQNGFPPRPSDPRLLQLYQRYSGASRANSSMSSRHSGFDVDGTTDAQCPAT
jgi:hypothetical protein